MGTSRVRLAKAGRGRARRVRTGRVRGVTAVTGLARVGTVALALLVCACVFIALAGPGVSLRVRTQALHERCGLPPPAEQSPRRYLSFLDRPDLNIPIDIRPHTI